MSTNPFNIIYRDLLENNRTKDTAPACPICNAVSREFLEVPAVGNQEVITYHKCTACRTVFLDQEKRHRSFYAESFEKQDPARASTLLKHYLEIGAGPDLMTQVLMERMPPNVRSFCSVGCGVGLDLDILSRVAPSIEVLQGYEPNSYGEVDEIQASIINRPLDREELKRNPQRFDCIFASEVIEHVPDPLEFAKIMRTALARPDGTFILTTPNADFIHADNPAGDVYAALFPGEHKIILTQEALTTILEQADFNDIHVVSDRNRLVAHASPQKPTWKNSSGHRTDQPSDVYIDYLTRFMQATPEASRSPLAAGNCYRLFVELVNRDQIEAALSIASRYQCLLEHLDTSGSSPTLKQTTISKSIASRNFDQRILESPSFLGPFAFFMAMAARRRNHLSEAISGFQSCLQLLEHDQEISPSYFQFSCALIEPCKSEIIGAQSISGRSLEALETWNKLHQKTPQKDRERSTENLLQIFIDAINLGNTDAARTIYRTIETNSQKSSTSRSQAKNQEAYEKAKKRLEKKSIIGSALVTIKTTFGSRNQ